MFFLFLTEAAAYFTIWGIVPVGAHHYFLCLFAGNFDWVGNDFTQNAGTGLVINQADVTNDTSIIKQLKDVFERDWYSPYARSLQPTKQPNCSGLFRFNPASDKTVTYNASGKDPESV